jgi:acyl carrier protein
MDIKDVQNLSLNAFLNIQEDLDIVLDEPIVNSSNILEILDSMDVVNLIMETESVLEQELGRYIPLANEHTFDAENSPLLSFEKWTLFIQSQINI